MALADELADLSRITKGPACRLKVWLDGLDAKQRSEVCDAFRDHRVLHRVLADHIRANGPTITASNISHHRTGNCTGCRQAGYDLTRL